ncbi:beta-amyrin 28-monooxygenase [Trifolium repens]|nr:beta-amyrin 28-monooxygenase [Trifolium repens]
MAFQRSRSKWLKEGDLNSKFFHNCIKSRLRRNMLVALRTQHGWVEGPSQVREEVVSYFRNHFSNEEWPRPNLDGIVFPQVSLEKMSLLTDIFTLDEISEVVRGCDGSKSPGPDGYNFAFVKHFWNLMKHEVRIMFDQFHGNECLPKCLSSYFLTLIPKVRSPQAVSDFRPISLLGCLYKMVAKVLALRLAIVLGDLIPKTQSAFLKGRQLVEGVVVINEAIDFAKKSGKDCLIFKVDFEKAYDSVDWGFLDYMLRRFGFNTKWRGWMKACVCTGCMSILVNGSPTEEINIKKGLKQGDPLAPLLFLLVSDGLGALMRKAVERGRFKPFCVGRNNMQISMLQYADDTLCIGEATVDNLWAIKSVLRGFEMASGLKVNFWKSCIMGVNVSNEFLDMASGFLNCRIGQIPFIYLRLPVGANPRLVSTWSPMLDVIRKRLGSWGNKYVSLGGRIVLINAVLSSIPIFFLSYMKLPVKVWREVVKIQRNFLWGGLSLKRRISWVKWEDICRSKKEGGLGIRDLRVVNLSLLAKWRWKLLTNEDEVWKNVMVAKYGEHVLGNVRLEAISDGVPCSTWWKDLCCLDSHGEWFRQVVTKKVGRGNLCSFWKDIWVENQSLEQRFPRLFSISTQKDEVISEVGSWRDGVWR